MVNHFREYAENICNKFNFKKDSLVVDIGSNDGTLLKFFREKKLKILGIDPATEIALKATKEGIETIPKFFNIKLANEILKKYGKAKIVTANNAFAHMDDLNEIVELSLGRNSGARALRSVMEEQLLEIMYHIYKIPLQKI